MKTMPKYDVTAVEQTLIDHIPEAVNTHDPEVVRDRLKAIYTDEKNAPYASALLIIEKYLFRAYELIYFVGERAVDFDYDGYFFDESIHNAIIDSAKKKLNKEEAASDYTLGRSFVEKQDYASAGEYFKRSALGGDAAGAFNYGVTLSRGEGTVADPIEGAFWYWVAANENNYKGMINLAFCYRNGGCLCPDFMMSVYWDMRAGLAGSLDGVRSAASAMMKSKGYAQIGQMLMIASMDMNNESNVEQVKMILNAMINDMQKYIYNRRY